MTLRDDIVDELTKAGVGEQLIQPTADAIMRTVEHSPTDDDSPMPDHRCIHAPDTNSHDCNCTYGGDHHMNDFQGFR